MQEVKPTGGGQRNYTNESKRNCLKQILKLQNVKFTALNYWELYIPKDSIIYCDPPYEGTTKYNDDQIFPFDYEMFWEWCRLISEENQVFISEYNAPSDFKCVWQQRLSSSLTKETGSKYGIEKLFIYNKL